MPKIEQTLTSIEVADMVEKEHKFLMRDIRRYLNQIAEGNEKYGGGCKVAPSDFFTESTYRSAQNKELPCYRITKKGCEFIAHKLTGTKGTIFTARYINRFHEMQDILSKQEEKPETPWFIRKFRGHYIMLFRDFEAITGIDPIGRITGRLECGRDYNGYGAASVSREDFMKEYGFDCGEDKCVMYFYLRGIGRAMSLCRMDNKLQMEKSAYDTVINGLKAVQPPKKTKAKRTQTVAIASDCGQELPVQVNIILGNGEVRV